MTELEIKKALIEYFLKDDANITIGAEVPFQYGERRADLITLKDGLATAYEIKGSGDNISRLDYQLISYKSFFDYCYIVCEKNHLDVIKNKINRTIGLILIEGNLVHIIRKSHKFTRHSKEILASSLPVIKLRTLTNNFKIRSKHDLCHYAEKHCSLLELRTATREFLTNRYNISTSLLRADVKNVINTDDIITLTKRPPGLLFKRS